MKFFIGTKAKSTKSGSQLKQWMFSILVFTALSMAVLATVLLIQHNGGLVHASMPVLSIVVCVFSYGAGVLPVPYIVMSEIFNFQIRARLMGFLVTYGWFMCFVQVITFTPISQTLAYFTVFSYGMQTGWMSPSIKTLQSDDSPAGYPLSDNEISWVASTLCILAVVSSYVYSYIADRYGRKASVIATAFPQALAWIIKLISSHPISLIVARGLCGFGGAGCFCVAPMYAKEITDDSIRGVIGSMGMLLQSVGTLIMYALGAYLDYHTVLWIVLWFPLLNTLLLLKAPESPSYLVKIGKVEEAKATIASLRGVDIEEKTVIADVSQMVTQDEYYKTMPKISIKSILENKGWRRALWLSFLLMSMLDTGGNYAIFTYASVIIRESGVTVSPDLQALSFPAVMILGSILSMTCVEKFGRKPLLLTCLVFTALSMAVLATVLLIQHNGGLVHASMPVLSIVVCVFSYGAGVLPVPYIVMSEIFNFQIRARLMGFLVTYGWFMCFVQVITFTPISQTLGMHTMFYIFSAFNFVSMVVLLFCLPETKGKSMEEIEKLLNGESK